MPAYIIVDIDLQDPQRYETYKRAAPAIIARHGGEYLVRGGELEVLEGDWRPKRLVVLRFPDRKAIHAFLDDPEYRPLRELRHSISRSSMIAVDGL